MFALGIAPCASDPGLLRPLTAPRARARPEPTRGLIHICSSIARLWPGLLRHQLRRDFGVNSRMTLPAGVFDPLDLLTTLDLRDNYLTTLPRGIFDSLHKLTTL